MTPEQRSKALSNWAIANLPSAKADEFFGIVADCQYAARAEAVEEAAKIAEKLPYIQYPPGAPPLDPNIALSILTQVAAAIRERAKS